MLFGKGTVVADLNGKSYPCVSGAGSGSCLLFDVLECGPAWDLPSGGAEVLLVTKAVDEKRVQDAQGQLRAMFDHTEVSSCCKLSSRIPCMQQGLLPYRIH